MQIIYLKTSEILSEDEINLKIKNLPTFITDKCFKYEIKTKRLESLSAWISLNDLLVDVCRNNLKLGDVTFSTRGKPLIKNGSVSLSHSNGVVAVCYSCDDCAVDVEGVTLKNVSASLKRRLNLPQDEDARRCVSEWTKVEAVAKLKDKFSFKIDETAVKTQTFNININDTDYVITVAAKKEFKIKLV